MLLHIVSLKIHKLILIQLNSVELILLYLQLDIDCSQIVTAGLGEQQFHAY